MSRSSKSTEATEATEEYDADKAFAAALKALSAAAWHLRIASYALEEEFRRLQPTVYSDHELGASIASADLLAAQTDAIGTQTRRLRKRARNI